MFDKVFLKTFTLHSMYDFYCSQYSQELKYEVSILLLWLFWAICGRVSQAKDIRLCKVAKNKRSRSLGNFKYVYRLTDFYSLDH